MLEKLAKQTAVYGISTIAVRFLSYLLTPYYTRIFGQETYGIVTDIYALIPLALTLLTMGMESSYFRFSAKAEEAGGDVKAAKRRLFATTWGVTSLAAAVFFVVVAFFRDGISHLMGEAYVAHPEYIVWVGLIILFDVWSCIPFSRLREQGRALTVRRTQGVGRRAQCRPGRGIRPRRAFFHRVWRGVGLRRQPCRQCPDVAGNPRHRRSYRAQDQLGPAGRRSSPIRCHCSSVGWRVRPTSSSTAS